METIRVQISALSPAELAALKTLITVQTTDPISSNIVTLLTGDNFIDVLLTVYGDYTTTDITKTLTLYNSMFKSQFVNIGKMYLEMADKDVFNTYSLTTDTASDVAPVTTTNTVINPNVKEQISKAPMDNDSVHLETETNTTVNDGAAYDATTVSLSYDKTGIDHNATTSSTTTGNTNYLLADILSGQIAVQWRNIAWEYIAHYVGRFCIDVWEG